MDNQYDNISGAPEQGLPQTETDIAHEEDPFEPIQKAPGMTVVFLDEEQKRHGKGCREATGRRNQEKRG